MKQTLFVILAAALAAQAHPWACYHGDPQHSGRSAAPVGDSVWVAWSYSAGGDISGSPVVADGGRVLFGARDVKLYRLKSDGAEDWVADLGALGTSIYFSAPALDDEGNTYITTSRRLVKVDSMGSVVWSWPNHNSLSISHSPVIGQDGKIYFGCYSDSLYAVTPAGSLDWAVDLGHDVNSAPAVGLDGRIYIATTRGSPPWRLWAFEPNGDTAWTAELAGSADFASPAVGPDSVVYIGAERFLYAFKPDGSLLWRDSLAARIQTCPAIGNDSTLYVVAGSRLYNVSADSGTRWRVTIGSSGYSSPAVDGVGNVYVGSDNNALFVVDEAGTVLLEYTLPDHAWSSPAISAHGQVIVGCMNGTLYAFQGEGSGIAGRPSPPGPARLVMTPNPSTGRVRFAGNGPAGTGEVTVYDVAGVRQPFRLDGTGLDLTGLARGVYLVETRTEYGTARGKLVLR